MTAICLIATRPGVHAARSARATPRPAALRPLARPTPRLVRRAAAVPRAALRPTVAASTVASLGDTLTNVANAATNAFPVFVLGAAALGLANPASFSFFQPAHMTPALGITMLGMGLTLTFADFARVLATPKRVFAGFALQYTIMPLMAFAVSRILALPLDFAVGLCLVGSCPGGTASNVVTYLAKADVPLSVAMTTASTLGAVVATPLLTKLLLGTLVPVDVLALLVSTVQVVLLPVALGAALNQTFPKAVARMAPLSALSAVLLIALICGSVIAQNAAAVASAGPRLLLAVAALHAGGFALGYGVSKTIGMPEKVARTNSIEVGMQNSALGALLATAHFPANPLAAVPCAISACTHSVMGSLLAAFWRSQGNDDESAAPVAVAVKAVAAAVPELDIGVRREQVRSWIAGWRARTGASPGVAAAAAAPAAVVAAPAKAPAKAAEYSADQLAFLERKRTGASSAPAAPASSPDDGAAKFSPEQLAFLERKRAGGK